MFPQINLCMIFSDLQNLLGGTFDRRLKKDDYNVNMCQKIYSPLIDVQEKS